MLRNHVDLNIAYYFDMPNFTKKKGRGLVMSGVSPPQEPHSLRQEYSFHDRERDIRRPHGSCTVE